MKKWIIISIAIALLLLSLSFILFRQENNLAALSRQCGIDLTIGKVVSTRIRMVDFMEMEFPTQCYNIPMIPSVNKWKKVKSGKNFLFPKT